MIKERFMRGSAYIDIMINGRVLTFITPLLNFQPMSIDLDKLDAQADKIKKMNLEKEELEILSNLRTEKEMFLDLKSDLIKQGWRTNGSR